MVLSTRLKDERMIGRAEGREEGREEGKQETTTAIVKNMLKSGMTLKIIEQCTSLSLEEIYAIANADTLKN